MEETWEEVCSWVYKISGREVVFYIQDNYLYYRKPNEDYGISWFSLDYNSPTYVNNLYKKDRLYKIPEIFGPPAPVLSPVCKKIRLMESRVKAPKTSPIKPEV